MSIWTPISWRGGGGPGKKHSLATWLLSIWTLNPRLGLHWLLFTRSCLRFSTAKKPWTVRDIARVPQGLVWLQLKWPADRSLEGTPACTRRAHKDCWKSPVLWKQRLCVSSFSILPFVSLLDFLSIGLSNKHSGPRPWIFHECHKLDCCCTCAIPPH